MILRQHERLGYFCLFTAIGLWSTVEVVTRTILTEVPPIQLAWIRFFVGGLFLMALLPRDLRQRNLQLDRRILWFCAWVSVPGVVVSNIALQYSLKFTGAAVVATVYGASPLFVLALSRLLFGEPMGLARALGLGCGIVGIAVLSLGKPSVDFSLLGLVLALCAAGAFSLWTVLVKHVAGEFSGLPVTVLCFAFGVLFMTPCALLAPEPLDWGALPRHGASILYLSIGGTGVAYWLYFKGLAQVDATRAASLILLKPPAAALLAAFVLGEPLTWNLIAAMALIGVALYGVFFWHRPGPPSPASKTA